ENDAGWNVHRPRRGDADGGDLLLTDAGRGDGLANGFAHPFQAKFLAALRLGGQAHRALRPTVVIDDAALRAGAADIDTDIKRRGPQGSRFNCEDGASFVPSRDRQSRDRQGAVKTHRSLTVAALSQTL